MRAVFHTGIDQPWAEVFEGLPWALLPIGNRPLIEYWFELCSDLEIREVRLVLGEGGVHIEKFVGDGTRWGLEVSYSFQKTGVAPDEFLRRDPSLWSDGLLYLNDAVFPARGAEYHCHETTEGTLLLRCGKRVVGLISTRGNTVEHFIEGKTPRQSGQLKKLGLVPIHLASVRDYFDLNMRLLAGESARYLTPGYAAQDGSYVGYNVVTPPGTDLKPPLMIGNDCRFSPLSVVGPSAVVGNRVYVDAKTELSRCVVLDSTYIGSGLEIKERIVHGSRLIDPEDGLYIDIGDSWVLSNTQSSRRVRELVRSGVGSIAAVILLVLQAIPFALLWITSHLLGKAHTEWRRFHGTRGRVIRVPVIDTGPADSTWSRIWSALSLDVFPRLFAAVRGRLWLCGQEPVEAPSDEASLRETGTYFPGALSLQLVTDEATDPTFNRMEGLYYAYHRSIGNDIRMLGSILFRRFLRAFSSGAPSPEGNEETVSSTHGLSATAGGR